MKKVIFNLLLLLFASHMMASNSTYDQMCDCNSLTPSFTFQEIGDCMVEFSGDYSGDPCFETAGYGWNFDDGGFGLLGQNVTYTFPGPGNYVISLTVASSDGEGPCSQNIEQVITITCAPPFDCDCRDFDPSIEVISASGCGIDLAGIYGGEDCVTGVKYIWDMGDDTIILGHEVSHTYLTSGTYTVTLTVVPGEDGMVILDCVESVELVVHVNCGVTGDCTCESLSPLIQVEDQSECEVDLMGIHGGYPCLEDVSYVWDFGDETGSFGQNVSHEYEVAGWYTIRLIVTANDGINDCDEVITTLDIYIDCGSTPIPCVCAFAPEIEIANTTGCEVTFSGTHGGDPCLDNVKFIWNFGDGSANVLGEEVTHQFDNSGTYTVTLTVSFSNADMTCQESTEEVIEVHCGGCNCGPIDADVVIDDQSNCTMDVRGVINESCYEDMLFVWFIDGVQSGVGQSATLEFPESGSYNLTLAIYGLGEEGEICAKEKVELTVQVDCEPCDCRRLSPLMEITAKPDCKFDFEGIQNRACFDDITYSWDFGDGTSATGPNASHQYTESGIYPVNLVVIATSGTTECKIRITEMLEVYCPESRTQERTETSQIQPELDLTVYPNPSSGFIHLEFNTSDSEVEIMIYSLSGQLVYEKHQIQSSSIDIDLNHLNKGMYSVKLIQGNNTSIKYLILN